jgi:F0F1-type ATP synthase assembly protein I
MDFIGLKGASSSRARKYTVPGYGWGLQPRTGVEYAAVAATPDARTLKTLGQLGSVGLAFVLALVMGFAGGYWLDRRLGTTPWLTFTGFAMGVAAGILNVVRTMQSVAAAERTPPAPPDSADRR